MNTDRVVLSFCKWFREDEADILEGKEQTRREYSQGSSSQRDAEGDLLCTERQKAIH